MRAPRLSQNQTIGATCKATTACMRATACCRPKEFLSCNRHPWAWAAIMSTHRVGRCGGGALANCDCTCIAAGGPAAPAAAANRPLLRTGHAVTRYARAGRFTGCLRGVKSGGQCHSSRRGTSRAPARNTRRPRGLRTPRACCSDGLRSPRPASHRLVAVRAACSLHPG